MRRAPTCLVEICYVSEQVRAVAPMVGNVTGHSLNRKCASAGLGRPSRLNPRRVTAWDRLLR